MSRLLQWPWLEALFWVSVLAVVVVFPSDLSLATAIAVMALFAVSLDLALGIAGILTLGHALYFGAGAYAAAALATLGWAEPVSGVVLAGIAAALLAGVAGPFILRSRGLPLIMVTLVLGLFAFELANKASDFTGGDNGLSDIVLAPVLGVFHWSVYAQVEYLYVLAFLFVGFQGAKRIVGSPFGLALRGIRDNPVRMAVMMDKMKMNAPQTPSSGRYSRSFRIIARNSRIPMMRNGRAIIHQTIHHCQGKNPSIMCIVIQDQLYLI